MHEGGRVEKRKKCFAETRERELRQVVKAFTKTVLTAELGDGGGKVRGLFSHVCPCFPDSLGGVIGR